jgi:hypothetical protein
MLRKRGSGNVTDLVDSRPQLSRGQVYTAKAGAGMTDCVMLLSPMVYNIIRLKTNRSLLFDFFRHRSNPSEFQRLVVI